jgi:hypothetical protein
MPLFGSILTGLLASWLAEIRSESMWPVDVLSRGPLAPGSVQLRASLLASLSLNPLHTMRRPISSEFKKVALHLAVVRGYKYTS